VEAHQPFIAQRRDPVTSTTAQTRAGMNTGELPPSFRLAAIAEVRQTPGAMDAAGLYIHLPFCRTRCPYCDFTVVPLGDGSRVAGYFAALHRQLDRIAAAYAGSVATVYLGGGTPSAVDSAYLCSLLDAVRVLFDLDPSAEVTVEVNPGDGSAALVREIATAGVNRLSIGAQSFDDGELTLLGRRHAVAEIYRTVEAATTAGIDNLSLDLMVGLPGQDVARVAANVAAAVGTGAPHLSAYLLHLEEQVPMARRVRAGRLTLPPEAAVAAQYRTLHQSAAEVGILAYEVSNFARPGFEARHNLGYWRCVPCLAAGLGAHGMRLLPEGAGWERWVNETHLDRFLAAIAAGGDGVTTHDRVIGATARAEWTMLRLRLAEGVARDILAARFGEEAPAWLDDRLAPYHDRGWVAETPVGWRLTVDGWLFSDTVFCDLFG